MIAQAEKTIADHEAQARAIAAQVRDGAAEAYRGDWSRKSIAETLGAYALLVVNYLDAVPLTGQQKFEIAVAGGRILIAAILGRPCVGLAIGTVRLTCWLESLIEISCAEEKS